MHCTGRDPAAGDRPRRGDGDGVAARGPGTIGIEEDVEFRPSGPAAREDAGTPIWMLPPSWLYLPHQFPQSPPRAEAPCEWRGAHDGDGERLRAAEGTIRGRDRSLGALSAEAASAGVGSDMGDSPTISGPLTGPGPRTQEYKSGAQIRLEARNAHLRWSLEAHAERVARKRGQADCGGARPSAADRIEALRRRLAAKTASRAAAELQGDDGRGHSVAAVPATGTSASASSSSGRNELRKIHFDTTCTDRIQDGPAWEAHRSGGGAQVAGGSAGAAAREQPCTAADLGRRSRVASSVEDAASGVAWHSNAHLPRPPRGAG